GRGRAAREAPPRLDPDGARRRRGDRRRRDRLRALREGAVNGATHPIGDLGTRKRFIARSVWLTVPGALAIIAIAYRLVPPLAGPSEARIVPILCVFFVFARAVYWWGYLRDGTLGRAPGVQLTFALTFHMLAAALLLLARSAFISRP